MKSNLKILKPVSQAFFIFIILLSLVLPLIPLPVQAITDWYSSDWGYRKELTVYGSSSGVQTNYQKLIRVYANNISNPDIPENLAQYTTGDDGVTSEILTATWRGQSFVSEATATVKKVWLKIVKVGTPGATYTCAITGIAAGVPDETDIKCSGTITGNYVSTTEDWYEFDMGAGAALTSGTSYGIILYSAGGSAGNALKWRSDSSGAYTGGTAFTTPDSGVNWTAVPAVDYMFQVLTSTTGTVPLRVDTEGHCQADFDDLRFTASDGATLLDYWIENSATCAADGYADCWVELDTIAQMTGVTEHTHYYLYYGNAAATAVSNGTNTFVTFDNFDSYANGSNINGQGGWAGTVGGAVVSTDHAYSGANSLKIVGSAGYNIAYYPLIGSSQSYLVGQYIYKEDASYLSIRHGDGTNGDVIAVEADEDLVYLSFTPAWDDTGINTVADAWYILDSYSYIWNGAGRSSFIVRYLNGSSYTGIESNDVVAPNDFRYEDMASGVGNDWYVDDFFIAKFVVSQPLWGTAGAEEVVPPLSIQDAKVFESYKETGDWLIVIRYLNTYPPYYDTYDPKKYFVLQLLSGTTVLAQTAMPAWGNKVGNIYLNADQVSALTYGSAYTVRMYGTFTGNPSMSFSLSPENWLGSDLLQLDSWVISSASVIGNYYSQSLTTDISGRGEVLNSTGGTIFSAGINGLSTVRPEIYQVYTTPTTYNPSITTQTYRIATSNWQANWGADGTIMLTRFSNLLGVSGNQIGMMFVLIVAIALIILAFPAGHTGAALIAGVISLFLGIGFGLDIIWIGMLAIIAAFLLWKQVFLDK